MSVGMSALVTLLSLNLTASFVGSGQVAGTLPVTGATATTPIAITSPAHGVPSGRVVHGVVAGVTGTTEANGTWVLTPTDPNTFTLQAYTGQGVPVPSVGVNAYAGGGTIQYAFPDYQVLLGRRWIQTAAAVAAPRIVFVPTDGRKWGFEPYGGQGPAPLQERGSAEQQSEKLQPQIATEFVTFEVLVTGAANPPQPDFGDIDATQTIAQCVFAALYAGCGGRVACLHESWPSQKAAAGSMTQRGDQWLGIIEVQMPVTFAPLRFVPIGTYLQLTVEPVNAGSTDGTIIVIHGGTTP